MRQMDMVKALYHTSNIIVKCDTRKDAYQVINTFIACFPWMNGDIEMWVTLQLMSAFVKMTVPDISELLNGFAKSFGV